MHTERYRVPPRTWAACRAADAGLAVGTTAVRALERVAATGELEGTHRAVHPRRLRFAGGRSAAHQLPPPPQRRCSLLVAAFVGPRWRDLYADALREGYRFLSFGDAMLLERDRVNPLVIDVQATDGAARAGSVTTPHGTFRDALLHAGRHPGRRARTSTPATSQAWAPRSCSANTYHLMLRPGAEVVAELGGLHGFMAWGGPMLTDSGGFQVFSLEPKVDDDGVTFRSTYDGSSHRLTPERAVAVQELLGADIQMVLDVCPPLPSPPDGRAHRRWSARPLGRRGPCTRTRRHRPGLFGIVQGGVDPTCAPSPRERTVALGFDGYGIGGLSVGEPDRRDAAGARRRDCGAARGPAPLPDGRRRSGAVGRGRRARGIDLFDCVLPTRHARHGTVLTTPGAST